MSMEPSDREQQHRERMQRKKAIVDAAIARAEQDKGLLLVLTGNGKGKSSSAFGMVARALGHNMRVGVAQFIKGRSGEEAAGEQTFISSRCGVVWHVLGEGFTWETQNLARDKQTAQHGWAVARELLRDPSLHLVVLDELTYLLKYGWLDIATVLGDLQSRPAMQHVVVTGRGAPEALVHVADTVTEMRDCKHAFRAGVRAQQGVDL